MLIYVLCEYQQACLVLFQKLCEQVHHPRASGKSGKVFLSPLKPSISCELMVNVTLTGTDFSKVDEVMSPRSEGDPGRDTMGAYQASSAGTAPTL